MCYKPDFHKHFKFAFTISDLTKCLFYDFALKIRASTGKSARPLVQNRQPKSPLFAGHVPSFNLCLPFSSTCHFELLCKMTDLSCEKIPDAFSGRFLQFVAELQLALLKNVENDICFFLCLSPPPKRFSINFR